MFHQLVGGREHLERPIDVRDFHPQSTTSGELLHPDKALRPGKTRLLFTTRPLTRSTDPPPWSLKVAFEVRGD